MLARRRSSHQDALLSRTSYCRGSGGHAAALLALPPPRYTHPPRNGEIPSSHLRRDTVVRLVFSGILRSHFLFATHPPDFTIGIVKEIAILRKNVCLPPSPPFFLPFFSPFELTGFLPTNNIIFSSPTTSGTKRRLQLGTG